jgi:RecJ-like exonuclease
VTDTSLAVLAMVGIWTAGLLAASHAGDLRRTWQHWRAEQRARRLYGVDCEACAGRGWIDSTAHACPECWGEGVLYLTPKEDDHR